MAKQVFALTAEATLKAELKSGKLRQVYYLYGEETFLTRMYADRIVAAAGGEQSDGLNFMKLRGAPAPHSLSDFAESLPFFAEHKCVKITDLDAEDMDNDSHKELLKLIDELPETTVMVICQTGLEIDDVKPKAKTKKLIQTVEKRGMVCRFQYMTAEMTAAMAAKKAQKMGCTLSPENATHLSGLCGRSLTLIQNEVEKLCSCQQSGEITRELIDALTPKLLDASAYDLSTSILAGKTADALKMMDELFQQREEPILILSALSGAAPSSFPDARKTVKSSAQNSRRTPGRAPSRRQRISGITGAGLTISARPAQRCAIFLRITSNAAWRCFSAQIC